VQDQTADQSRGKHRAVAGLLDHDQAYHEPGYPSTAAVATSSRHLEDWSRVQRLRQFSASVGERFPAHEDGASAVGGVSTESLTGGGDPRPPTQTFAASSRVTTVSAPHRSVRSPTAASSRSPVDEFRESVARLEAISGAHAAFSSLVEDDDDDDEDQVNSASSARRPIARARPAGGASHASSPAARRFDAVRAQIDRVLVPVGRA
jgi:hypothetical protein